MHYISTQVYAKWSPIQPKSFFSFLFVDLPLRINMAKVDAVLEDTKDEPYSPSRTPNGTRPNKSHGEERSEYTGSGSFGGMVASVDGANNVGFFLFFFCHIGSSFINSPPLKAFMQKDVNIFDNNDSSIDSEGAGTVAITPSGRRTSRLPLRALAENMRSNMENVQHAWDEYLRMRENLRRFPGEDDLAVATASKREQYAGTLINAWITFLFRSAAFDYQHHRALARLIRDIILEYPQFFNSQGPIIPTSEYDRMEDGQDEVAVLSDDQTQVPTGDNRVEQDGKDERSVETAFI